ncbi:unnamed protein product [Closterium sp. Naga37s-1]|nr:unnamed protein product [Closterium sp. Naga37s-1]
MLRAGLLSASDVSSSLIRDLLSGFPHHHIMPRQPRKAVQPHVKTSSGDVRESATKGHQSEPATPKPLLKDVEGPFADDTRVSLVKRLAALKFPYSEKAASGDANAEEGEGNKDEVTPPAADPEVPADGEEDEKGEDDGYLNDDPEERLDPMKAGEIAVHAGFSITLLVPTKFKEEVPRTIDTVKGLLALWRRHMSAHVLMTTRCQKMVLEYLVNTVLEKRGRTPYLSGATFHRVVDSVMGADTDKIKAVAHVLDARMKKILRDPALVLISTGGSREDWIRVQEACSKAHGTRFIQAETHVKSVQHCTALLKGGAASRVSKGKLKVIPIRKEYGL